MVAGVRPRRTSDTQNSVSVDATAMSQAAMSPMPPANAAPCTRATVGFASACRRLSMVPKAIASFRFSSKSSSPILFIQFRSAPAQNTLPRPASTTARTAGSCSNSPKAAVSSAIIVSLKALRTSGRLSHKTATPRPAWISMVLCVMPRPSESSLCKPLTRLDNHLGPHRIGDETFLVGIVVQFGEHRRRRRRSEFDRGPQRDSRHRHATFGILLEHAFGIVDVAVDDQLPRRGQAHEPEHVTGRERGDEELLRIGAGPVRRAGRNILLCGVSSELQGLEFNTVRAAVFGGLERHAVPLPLGLCSVNGHPQFPYIRKTPNRVSSIGALRDAEIASARMRRVSSGAITPSSQRRAVA